MKYNVNTLSFLIASFNDVINSFGQNSKSVEFYKRNVNGLISIGQVSFFDAEIIERIVGMKNTNAVKWESATKNIKEFIDGMNAVDGINDSTSIAMMLDNYVNNRVISDKIRNYILEVYGIQKGSVKERKSNFGKFSNNTINISENIDNKKDDDNKNFEQKIKFKGESYNYIKNKLIEITNTMYNKKLYIRIDNIHAVCSSDVPYYTKTVKELIDGNANYCVELLHNGAKAEIGVNIKNTNICGPSTTFSKIGISIN